MKIIGFAFAALLGLGLSTTAFAQTIPSTSGTTTAPGTVTPGQVGTSSGTLSNGTINGGTINGGTINGGLTTPAGAAPISTTPGTVYSPGATTVPNATLDATQPVGTSPVTPGATRRTTTGGRNTTTKPVRP